METTDCRRVQDDLPLLFTGALDSARKEELINHLRSCAACREVVRCEGALFAVAAAKGSQNPLEDHPSADLLDSVAQADENIAPDERRQVEDHVATCEVCRSALVAAKRLPVQLSDLVEDDEIPVIASASTAGGFPPGNINRGKLRRVTSLTWAAGVAAAALLVFVGVYFLSNESPPPTLMVSFVGQMRGETGEIELTTNAVRCKLDAEVFIDPQPEHRYVWRVLQTSDSSILGQGDFTSWDESGYGRFDLAVGLGELRLDVLDIHRADTHIVQYPFSVQMQR